MDKELFRKTEGKLYRYFESKKKVRSLNREIESLKYRIETIEYDIKNTNIVIDYYQNGTGIQERVQTSNNGSSYAESEMCKEIEKLEKEHIRATKKVLKVKSKIREIEEFINHMKRNIEDLNEEDKRFIELKYGDKKSILQIALKLNMAKATAYRKREDIVKVIAEYDNTLFKRIV